MTRCTSNRSQPLSLAQIRECLIRLVPMPFRRYSGLALIEMQLCTKVRGELSSSVPQP